MENLREQLFEYADWLYSKAIQEMNAGRFRMVDVYALSSHGAAVYLASDDAAPKQIREQASQLEQAAWNLSKQAHSAQRLALLEPRMSGDEANDDDLEEVREEVRRIAEMVTNR